MNNQNGQSGAVRLPDSLNCLVSVYSEKIADNGEDAYVYTAAGNAVVVGAFDGCGGAGAKRLERLQGKTGAYAASRIAAGTVRDYFAGFNGRDIPGCAGELKKSIIANLRKCSLATGGESRLISSVVKSFPTTAALALCREAGKGLELDCFWAGDSRVYYLCEEGLYQLTADDLSVQDAMENLYDDGVMTNVISLSADFTIHHSAVRVNRPGIVFAATDGCFGYISSPMEFEFMLVDALTESGSVEQWEKEMHRRMTAVSGDDFTLCGAVFGFDGFEDLRACFVRRRETLISRYMRRIKDADREGKTRLWEEYRKDYYRYLPLS